MNKIKDLINETKRLRDRATPGVRYVDRDFPESKVSNAKLVGRYYTRDDAEFDCHAANHMVKLASMLEVALDAINKELKAMRGCCACGAEEPDGEGYKGVTCYLHEGLEKLSEIMGAE